MGFHRNLGSHESPSPLCGSITLHVFYVRQYYIDDTSTHALGATFSQAAWRRDLSYPPTPSSIAVYEDKGSMLREALRVPPPPLSPQFRADA